MEELMKKVIVFLLLFLFSLIVHAEISTPPLTGNRYTKVQHKTGFKFKKVMKCINK